MKVITLNVRGINDPTKRITLFKWLENNHFDIICLQETFCTSESIDIVKHDWKGPSYHSTSASKHSKGVSILFNSSFEHKLLDIHSDNDGRKLLLNIKRNDNILSIINIYSPTDEKNKKWFFNHTKS